MDDKKNNLKELWQEVLKDIKLEVSRANFLTLFKNANLVSLDNDQAIISSPSVMARDLLQKRFADIIKTNLSKHTNHDYKVSFVVKPLPQDDPQALNNVPLFTSNKTTPSPSLIGHLPRVRADFTFSSFAVSTSNQLAFVSANTVANNIGKYYNPLFIYGPVGVGKTHLMHAIANHVYAADPAKKIIYITSEEFTNEVIEAIRNNETTKMKKRFRSANLLLIDDIQFIEGKERVQEELFHTFNILIDNGSQIALSSDRPPHEIKKLERRLSSRFAGGLTVDISPPDFELKTAILQKKAEKFGIVLPIDVAKFLSEKAEDIRSLEGLLFRIVTQAEMNNQPISLDLVKAALGLISEERKKHFHSEDVINAVCRYYQLKPTQLKGPKRDALLVRARQIAMYILKHELDLPYTEIGNALGGRDHTTIIHGVEKIESLVDNKAKITEDIKGITHLLRE